MKSKERELPAVSFAINLAIVLTGIIFVTTTPVLVSSTTDSFQDAAALVGTKDFQLNCSGDPNPAGWDAYVRWNLSPIRILPPKEGEPPNINFTYFNNGSSLLINELTTDLACIYECQEGKPMRVAAVEPLKCPSQDRTMKDGEVMTTYCSGNFFNYVKDPVPRLKPTLVIRQEDGTEVAKIRATKVIEPLELAENITVTDKMDNTAVICSFYFEPEGNISALPPTFITFCQYQVYVEHDVSWAKILPFNNDSSNVVQVGQQINCTANGRPAPSFEWWSDPNSTLATGETLTITNSMINSNPVTYHCIARSFGSDSFARDSVTIIVEGVREEEVQGGMAPWLIAVIVVSVLLLILLMVALIIFLMWRKNSKKPYKSKTGKYDPSAATNLIYAPTTRNPSTGTGLPNVVILPNSQSHQGTSPPPRPDYSTTPSTVRNDFGNDYNHRNMGMSASVGHGDLGMAGLSGSRAADLNMGSRGNLQDTGRRLDQQEISLSPKPTNLYSGSDEALPLPPLPSRQSSHGADPSKYYDNVDHNPKYNKRQNQMRSPPPPPGVYLDKGIGRQPSVTSTSTNRSASSEGSRMTGRSADKKPIVKPPKSTAGKKTGPVSQGQGEEARKHSKKAGNQRYTETGYPSDVQSLQGSEV